MAEANRGLSPLRPRRRHFLPPHHQVQDHWEVPAPRHLQPPQPLRAPSQRMMKWKPSSRWPPQLVRPQTADRLLGKTLGLNSMQEMCVISILYGRSFASDFPPGQAYSEVSGPDMSRYVVCRRGLCGRVLSVMPMPFLLSPRDAVERIAFRRLRRFLSLVAARVYIPLFCFRLLRPSLFKFQPTFHNVN